MRNDHKFYSFMASLTVLLTSSGCCDINDVQSNVLHLNSPLVSVSDDPLFKCTNLQYNEGLHFPGEEIKADLVAIAKLSTIF